MVASPKSEVKPSPMLIPKLMSRCLGQNANQSMMIHDLATSPNVDEGLKQKAEAEAKQRNDKNAVILSKPPSASLSKLDIINASRAEFEELSNRFRSKLKYDSIE